MIWIVVMILPICIYTIYIIVSKIKKDNNSLKKNKIFKIIIIANIILICILNFILPFYKEINLYGLIIFVIINVISFLICNIISKRKTTFIIAIVVYFALMCIIPLYKCDDHIHIFKDRSEKIENYTTYYNSYKIEIFEK